MPTLDAAIDRINAGPRGAHIGAFFDFDGTLIDGYSVGEFYKHRLRQREVGWGEAALLLLQGLQGVATRERFTAFVKQGFKAYKGQTVEQMQALGEQLFSKAIANRLFPEAWRLVQAHQRMGHTLVVASSATRFQIEPMARELGIPHVLCTAVEVRRGVLTGRIAGEVAWGEGKAAAVRALAARRRIDLTRSHAYANGDEDLAFLQTAGLPCAINPQPALAAAAQAQAWPVLQFAARAGTPELRTAARSVAAYTGMAWAAALGIGAGWLGGGRRDAVNLAATLTSEVGLALAGIRLNVQGEQHLWAARPAVFVFNHQSQLDLLIMAKLLRQDFSGVAKMHTKNVPGFGPFLQFAGVAFVEPGAGQQNRRALEPALHKLAQGLSMAMAPEGTRSATPRLGAFRKGAFHLARQAGVPIVPVVLRNAGDLLRRGELALRAGSVDVQVLPPVPTAGWRAADIDTHVARVRQMFVDTLEAWSAPAPPPPGHRLPAVDAEGSLR
ncbi:MAG: HAD-IB family hydrolase [Ideonella sp.]|nr:HAD-IB family hydrolase [Ideonella sp.]